jgi:hypothetical protein
MTLSPYDADYSTCSYTHVWLRVMHDTRDPSEVSRVLGLEPTSSHVVGSRVSERSERVRRSSGWFLESSGNVESRDARHHLDWLLNRVAGKERAFAELRCLDYQVDVCCRWDSKFGHGGPTLYPEQMAVLGSLGVELWFDIYLD